jgi:fructokinase
MEKQILQIAAQNPYGFTFNCKTNSLVKYGIVVSYEETQNCFGENGLRKVIEHAMNHDSIIGGWLNSENGHFYFDSCKVFTNLKEAIEFGRANKQIAIFDLTNLNEIKL